MGASASFETTLWGVGNNAGIVVPPEVLEALGAGKRPPVLVNVNGYEYRNTVGAMGGKAMISFNAAVRKDTGLAAGDAISVTLTVMDEPREANVSEEFAAAMEATGTRAFFDALSNSLQRFHADSINSAKTDETRQRRIEKAVGLFAEGKKR